MLKRLNAFDMQENFWHLPPSSSSELGQSFQDGPQSFQSADSDSCDRNISLSSEIWLMRSIVTSIFLYTCES